MLPSYMPDDQDTVRGVDSLNDYYDVRLKRDRLDLLLKAGLEFEELDLSKREASQRLFKQAGEKANELMAHAYASMYGIPVTGLRFFTDYGP